MGGSNARELTAIRSVIALGQARCLGGRGCGAGWGGLVHVARRRWCRKGKLTLAWHTNIAARWLDPQQHDGTASPDNFLMALHDGLIKNYRDTRYDHPALAERFEFAEDAKSATFTLRAGTKFHDGSPVTPADVKWSYEHYRGAWGEVLRERTAGRRGGGRQDRAVPLQGAVPRFPDPDGHRQCVRRRLGGAGEIL